jgi:hypothetical protein
VVRNKPIYFAVAEDPFAGDVFTYIQYSGQFKAEPSFVDMYDSQSDDEREFPPRLSYAGRF